MPTVAKIDQGVQLRVHRQENATAITTITTVRTTELDEFLTPKAETTIATFPGSNVDTGFIYELQGF